MKRLLFLLLILGLPMASAARVPENTEREAVRLAVLDYVEGVYNVEPARIERSVHTDLTKLGFLRRQTETAYHTVARMNFQQLLEFATIYNRDRRLPKDAPKEIAVFEVLDQTASARLTAAWGIDFLHLAKFDGKWKIINVLWQSPPRKD